MQLTTRTQATLNKQKGDARLAAPAALPAVAGGPGRWRRPASAGAAESLDSIELDSIRLEGAPPRRASRELRGSRGMGVVSNNWLDCVLLSILYMFKPSC